MSAGRREAAAVIFAVAIAVLTGILCPILPAPSARAEPASEPVEVLVSRDGVHFTPGLRGALITGGDALIPGSAVSADLWVRNPAPVPAALRISGRNVVPTSVEFADAVALTAWENGTAAGAPLSLAALSACAVLLEPRELQPGETAVIHLRFDMADVAGSIGQRETAALTLVVAMRDAEAGAFPEAGCGAGAGGGADAPAGPSAPAPEDGAGSSPAPGTGSAAEPGTTEPAAPREGASSSPWRSLAYTGSGPVVAALLAAALLIGSGAALTTSRRRGSRTDD